MNLHRLFLTLVLLGSAAAQNIAARTSANFQIGALTSTDALLPELALDLRQPVLDQAAISAVCQDTSPDDKDLASVHIFDVVLRHRIALPVTTNNMVNEDDCPTDKHGCHTCVAHWDGEKCVDNPGVTHHGLNYSPGRGEMCWIITKCWCRQGQVPSGPNCGSCSYAGQEVVCRPA